MSKYVTDTEELRKAIALLGYVDGKLENLSKRITATYYQLESQKSSEADKARSEIKAQGALYDLQWENILSIKAFLEVVLNETLLAEEKAKADMEKEFVPGNENHNTNTNKPVAGNSPNVNVTPTTNVVDEMSERYRRLLQETGRTSFNGACSAFVYQQLRVQGIVSYNGDAGIGSGKDYYAVWSQRGYTSTGYRAETYGGVNGLRDLLNTNPGQVIKNVAVSFNYDGANYLSREHGHVMLISEIRDGKVYFMESAAGSLYNLDGRAYAEGEPVCLSVNDFLRQYPNMNGVVHFHK